MDKCIFCMIARKEIPASIVYEDDDVLAFRDLNPQAPQHILIIPKHHIARIENLEDIDVQLMGKIMIAAKKVAEKLELKNGYRCVFNNGADGGQEVEHIHLHLMGGRKFSWPAG